MAKKIIKKGWGAESNPRMDNWMGNVNPKGMPTTKDQMARMKAGKAIMKPKKKI